jgi:hypothetical protein
LSLLLTSGSHTLCQTPFHNINIQQQQQYEEKTHVKCGLVGFLIVCRITSLIYDVILVFMFLTFWSLDMMSRAATGVNNIDYLLADNLSQNANSRWSVVKC